MTFAQLIGEIERLPVAEQLQLVEAVWERLAGDPRAVPVPVSHLAEVTRRLAEHDVAPDDVVGWDADPQRWRARR